MLNVEGRGIMERKEIPPEAWLILLLIIMAIVIARCSLQESQQSANNLRINYNWGVGDNLGGGNNSSSNNGGKKASGNNTTSGTLSTSSNSKTVIGIVTPKGQADLGTAMVNELRSNGYSSDLYDVRLYESDGSNNDLNNIGNDLISLKASSLISMNSQLGDAYKNYLNANGGSGINVLSASNASSGFLDSIGLGSSQAQKDSQTVNGLLDQANKLYGARGGDRIREVGPGNGSTGLNSGAGSGVGSGTGSGVGSGTGSGSGSGRGGGGGSVTGSGSGAGSGVGIGTGSGTGTGTGSGSSSSDALGSNSGAVGGADNGSATGLSAGNPTSGSSIDKSRLNLGRTGNVGSGGTGTGGSSGLGSGGGGSSNSNGNSGTGVGAGTGIGARSGNSTVASSSNSWTLSSIDKSRINIGRLNNTQIEAAGAGNKDILGITGNSSGNISGKTSNSNSSKTNSSGSSGDQSVQDIILGILGGKKTAIPATNNGGNNSNGNSNNGNGGGSGSGSGGGSGGSGSNQNDNAGEPNTIVSTIAPKYLTLITPLFDLNDVNSLNTIMYNSTMAQLNQEVEAGNILPIRQIAINPDYFMLQDDFAPPYQEMTAMMIKYHIEKVSGRICLTIMCSLIQM